MAVTVPLLLTLEEQLALTSKAKADGVSIDALLPPGHSSNDRAHDARLVAAMNVRGVSHILTFNGADFSRYTNITVIDPNSLVLP